MCSSVHKSNYSTSLRYSTLAQSWDRTDFKWIVIYLTAGQMLVLTNLTGRPHRTVYWRSTDKRQDNKSCRVCTYARQSKYFKKCFRYFLLRYVTISRGFKLKNGYKFLNIKKILNQIWPLQPRDRNHLRWSNEKERAHPGKSLYQNLRSLWKEVG